MATKATLILGLGTIGLAATVPTAAGAAVLVVVGLAFVGLSWLAS